jgi:hypothetical protein
MKLGGILLALCAFSTLYAEDATVPTAAENPLSFPK